MADTARGHDLIAKKELINDFCLSLSLHRQKNSNLRRERRATVQYVLECVEELQQPVGRICDGIAVLDSKNVERLFLYPLLVSATSAVYPGSRHVSLSNPKDYGQGFISPHPPS